MSEKKQNPKHSVGDGAQREQLNKHPEKNDDYVEYPKEKEKLKEKEEEIKKRTVEINKDKK